MEVEERISLVENIRKRKTMSDEEGQIDLSKKSARKGISTPANSEVTVEKKIRQFKIFESKVKLIEMEDIEQKDLTDIKKNVSEMLVLITQLSEENKKKESSESAPEKIESRLNKFEEAIKSVCDSIKELKDKPAKAISYADKLKAPAVQKVVENNGNRCRHVVAIYPMEKKTAVSSDETKAVVLNTIAPTKEKLQICNVKKISNKGILVETNTKEDLDRVIKSEKLHAAGLKVEVPSKKKPLLIVYGVPKETTDKEFLSGLKKQNCKESKTTELFDTIRISHRTGDRSMDKVNVVIEVSPLVRESLLKNERVYIGWESLRIKDYTTVSRCYKCQAFGHVAKYCRANHETCGHCGQEGHSFKACPKKDQNPVCVNCRRAGKVGNHSSRSSDCPAYKFALANLISKIDYGKYAFCKSFQGVYKSCPNKCAKL
ncbi:hypothetical protein M0802_016837 [Mischocyttarus mexicanus]|nr:hypothetical protein M0802_016837 [Mischocyttarus mexicanus]